MSLPIMILFKGAAYTLVSATTGSDYIIRHPDITDGWEIKCVECGKYVHVDWPMEENYWKVLRNGKCRECLPDRVGRGSIVEDEDQMRLGGRYTAH